ncbi:fluoride efflux transporter FluC [Candidatus Poriferisodalis sp.]|uniref:fluoride efflux transporter FluC n=1 Tax=Candidatus Poriferisodalis sp. TaxID=3101277 RepID=UPI003B021B8D
MNTQRRIVAAVAAAGVVGAAARWAFTTRLDSDWALLIANVIGCGVVGWVTARHELVRRRRPAGAGIGSVGRNDAGPSVGLTIGFCGALTSMSALALQLAGHLDTGHVATAGAWLGLTIAACTAAFVVGRFAVLANARRP